MGKPRAQNLENFTRIAEDVAHQRIVGEELGVVATGGANRMAQAMFIDDGNSTRVIGRRASFEARAYDALYSADSDRILPASAVSQPAGQEFAI